MTSRLSPDDLLAALGSLKPAADDLTNAWYIGRREHTLQQVLSRASHDPHPVAEPPTPVGPNWRRRRRAILAVVAAVATLGGGAAWAYSRYAAWYAGGDLDGFTCMTSWSEPGDGDHADEQYGGPALTVDPVADCNTYADLTGKPRIVDPVAARYLDWRVVGPRAGMPAGAVPIAVAHDPRAFELENSLDDYIDGGMGRCLDGPAAETFARGELQRLGLADWTVTTREQEPRSGQCAMMFVPEPGVVEVRTFFGTNPDPSSSTLIPLLRSRIAEQCLSLREAEAVVADGLAADHHFATSIQLDPGAACTRVDLVITGSMQVFLYGPETATLAPPTPAVSEAPTVTESAPPGAGLAGPITVLLQQREEHRREIHDATELGIVDCMAERGFSYTPIVYPGSLGDPDEWAGLTQDQIDQWTLALHGARIPPESIAGPGPVTDPTIAVAEGPGSAIYFRRNSCLTIGSTAVHGDLVAWRTAELTLDHLAEQAFERSGGDQRRRAGIEAELANANQAAIERFTDLQNAAIRTARRILPD